MSKKSSKPHRSLSPQKFLPYGRKAGLPFPKGELDFFRYMVDQVKEEVLVTDSRARIVFVNQATVEGLGYSQKNILSRPVTDFFKEKLTLAQWRKRYFNEIKNRKKPLDYVINRVVKGGRLRTIRVTAVCMTYKSEEYVLTVGRDITDRLINQAKLKTLEDRYRLLGEQADEGILVLDLQGNILYANKAAGGVFHAPPKKIVGTPFEQYVDKGSLPQAWKCFKKVRGGAPSLCSGLNIKGKNGETVPSEFMASPIFIGEEVGQIQAVFRDMRRQKEMETLLQESEKMKALQSFVAGMTREIQQPLRGLMDRSRSLMDQYKDRDFEYIGYKEFRNIIRTLRTMNDQVRYCYDTVNRILSLNRRKAKLGDRYCSVNAVVLETTEMLKHSLEVSGITVRLNLSSRLPHVAIGQLDLSQAVSNIVTNSIQSLSSGGKIQITTRYEKAMNRVRIDCRDDGVGIPKEALNRVFEPFFTMKPRGLEKSSGLGLSIVYSIIKTHQGQIKIKSEYRKGTLVTILLPVYKYKKRRKA